MRLPHGITVVVTAGTLQCDLDLLVSGIFRPCVCRDRLVVALALCQITLEPGITCGYMFYFSHATEFFNRRSSPKSVRAEFDHHYETHRESLADLLNEVLNTVEKNDTTNPLITEWAKIRSRRFRRRSEPLITSGRIQRKHLDNQPLARSSRG